MLNFTLLRVIYLFILSYLLRATPAVEQNREQKLNIDAEGKKQAPAVEQYRELKYG